MTRNRHKITDTQNPKKHNYIENNHKETSLRRKTMKNDHKTDHKEMIIRFVNGNGITRMAHWNTKAQNVCE